MHTFYYKMSALEIPCDIKKKRVRNCILAKNKTLKFPRKGLVLGSVQSGEAVHGVSLEKELKGFPKSVSLESFL